jgi:hypothetical protein
MVVRPELADAAAAEIEQAEGGAFDAVGEDAEVSHGVA